MTANSCGGAGGVDRGHKPWTNGLGVFSSSSHYPNCFAFRASQFFTVAVTALEAVVTIIVTWIFPCFARRWQTTSWESLTGWILVCGFGEVNKQHKKKNIEAKQEKALHQEWQRKHCSIYGAQNDMWCVQMSDNEIESEGRTHSRSRNCGSMSLLFSCVLVYCVVYIYTVCV